MSLQQQLEQLMDTPGLENLVITAPDQVALLMEDGRSIDTALNCTSYEFDEQIGRPRR